VLSAIFLRSALVSIAVSSVATGTYLAPTHAAASSPQTASTSAPTSPQGPPPDRALLNRYCVSCHNQKLKTADLFLDTADIEHVGADRAVWEKVARKLRAGVMPPPGMPRPDPVARLAFLNRLETALDSAATVAPNPGRPSVHRLNRAEYTNAIRDLLTLEIDARSLLPVDDSSYGFDNIADVLSISPTLLESYMTAAQKISRLAVGDPAIPPVGETYGVSTFVSQDERMSEDLPFGTRGGTAIRHHFPVDGDYVVRVRLKRQEDQCCSEVVGLNDPHQIDIRVDGMRVGTFTVGGEQVDVTKADAGLFVRTPIKAGTRLIGVAFAKGTRAMPEGVGPGRLPQRSFFANRREFALAIPRVHQVEIVGPYSVTGVGDSASRRQIFICRPSGTLDEENCANRIISTLARRAFRRPIAHDEVAPLLSFYRDGRQEGGFEAGIELALRSILIDPDFLFRIQRDPPNVSPSTPYRVGDLELASRLSFFLWSSIPDDELLDLAARGQLKNPAVLEGQVRRMNADARSRAIVTNFAGQWLHLRNMRIVKPDAFLFPEFDDTLREAFQRETELFFESIMREDRSIVELLTANYSFLNERLARHYQVPNVAGSHFRRVTFGDDSVRGGLLGHGSILTVTSYPDRTSPTQRGKWLLENVIGLPPPPPPPDVAALPDPPKSDKPLTVRTRMEQHRTNPVCASCHRPMDPLGFALENFDAVGRWRSHEGGAPVDASGALPDGTTFQGPVALRKLLLTQREEFVMTVTEKLMTYALGRGLEPHDMPAVRRIVREAAPDEYRWSSLILGIVKSVPFQMCMSLESRPGMRTVSTRERAQ
jgi:hypothetical protein